MSARDDILNAAESLFGEIGFDATTTREITRQSGVNKALMYYYFENKDSLLASVLERYFLRLTGTLRESLTEGTDLHEKLDRLIDGYVDFLRRNANFSRIVQRESSGGKHVDTIFEHLSPLFQLGIESVRSVYPETREGEMSAEQLLISFYGMIVSYFTFGPLLGRLMGEDLFSDENIRLRKQHLRRMLDLVYPRGMERKNDERPEPQSC